MTAPSNANTSGLDYFGYRVFNAGVGACWLVANPGPNDTNPEPLVTAASAQARIAELEAERDQIAGESIWWKAVVGDGEYTPSGEVPSIKHLHPATVKPIFEAHKGSAVADVIAGLIFSRAITENREQFLVGYHTDRATAAEARADRLALALKETRNRVREWPIDDHETCMCGSPVASHGMGDGHSPVSQGDHAISMIVEAINEALQQETQP